MRSRVGIAYGMNTGRLTLSDLQRTLKIQQLRFVSLGV